jgi:6-pyruvoyltetrahydropterin/6-carboxytetrahydropterin synthase
MMMVLILLRYLIILKTDYKNKIMFRSTKRIDGFSTCFRQWKAEGTHCKFLHGYSVYFKATFEGELDFRNWVMDFGFLKRKGYYPVGHGNKTQEMTGRDWFSYMFDHTTVVAKDDPALAMFEKLDNQGVIQLRVVEQVGCEMFAKFVYDALSQMVSEDTNGRVKIIEVECFEHETNSAIYRPN